MSTKRPIQTLIYCYLPKLPIYTIIRPLIFSPLRWIFRRILISIFLPPQIYTFSSHTHSNKRYGIMCMTLISNISKWLICKVFVRTISSRLLGRRNGKMKMYTIYMQCMCIVRANHIHITTYSAVHSNGNSSNAITVVLMYRSIATSKPQTNYLYKISDIYVRFCFADECFGMDL